MYIIALSYCWAGPGQPDPENRNLSDVCELLGYLDTSRHFGDDNPTFKELNIADREVLIFWDYPCLYQKSDATTQGVTLLQLDTFERGPRVDQRLVRSRRDAVPAVHRELSSGGAHRVQRLRVAVLRVAGLDHDQGPGQSRRPAQRTQLGPPCWHRQAQQLTGNRSIYWLFQHVRRATRQLPVDPDTFDGEIVAKHARNGSDVNFLKQKFRQTFHALMTPAKKMELMNVPGSSRDHWRIFLTVTLRSCPQLVHVDLSRNEAIASTLEPFAALHGSLQYLNVAMSAGFGGTLQPLRGLPKLRHLVSVWVRGARRRSGASRELARPPKTGHGGVPWA